MIPGLCYLVCSPLGSASRPGCPHGPQRRWKGSWGRKRGAVFNRSPRKCLPWSHQLFDFIPYLASRHRNGFEPPSACPGAGDGVSPTQATGLRMGALPEQSLGAVNTGRRKAISASTRPRTVHSVSQKSEISVALMPPPGETPWRFGVSFHTWVVRFRMTRRDEKDIY